MYKIKKVKLVHLEIKTKHLQILFFAVVEGKNLNIMKVVRLKKNAIENAFNNALSFDLFINILFRMLKNE